MANVVEKFGTWTTSSGSSGVGTVDLGRLKGKFSLDLVFSSTGSLTLQRRYVSNSGLATGTWKDVKAAYTATTADEGESAGDWEWRLNFTAVGGDIEYACVQGQAVSR